MLIRRFILSGYKPEKGFYMMNGPGEAERSSRFRRWKRSSRTRSDWTG
jgi:hypothetical protein